MMAVSQVNLNKSASSYELEIDDPKIVIAVIANIERKCGKLSHAVPDPILSIIQAYLEPDDEIALVIEHGSANMKVGFCGYDKPKSIFPSIIGTPRKLNKTSAAINLGIGGKTEYIGNEAMAKRGILRCTHPIQHGIITNWTDIEKIWHHTFDRELQASPELYPVLMTEPPLNPKENREKITKIMFETFKCKAFYLTVDAVLAIYASGRPSGIVCSSGDSCTYTVPIYEGYTLPHATKKFDIGGYNVTQYLQQIMSEKGDHYAFTTHAGFEIVKDIKERSCYVSVNFEQDLKTSHSSTELEVDYELPDGRRIVIGNERFRAPEIIFNPDLIGMSESGMQQYVYNSIMACDVGIRRDLFANIVLSGGNTLFDGLSDRLYNEMKDLAPTSINFVKVVAPSERRISQWIGGSILTSLSTFEEMWITREDYDEFGPSIVHRRCT